MTWPAGRVSYRVEPGGPAGAPLSERIALMRRAFAEWRAVDCGGGQPPRLEVAESAAASSAIRFTDERPVPDSGLLALTTLRFKRERAEIARGRIDFHWSQLAPQGFGPALDSIALHEAGHFLGLAHSDTPGAVMFGEVGDGGRHAGELGADDVAAICAAYPPAPPAQAAGMPRWASVFIVAVIAAMMAVAWRAGRQPAKGAAP
jgi:hypothetical protein